MTRRVLPALLAISAVIGCASAGGNSPALPPEPETSSGTESIPTVPNKGSNQVWTITPVEQQETYRSAIRTRLEETNGLEKRKISFTTSAEYSFKLQRLSKDIEIVGSVSAFQVTDDPMMQTSAPISLAAPVMFDGKITDHAISLRQLNPGPSISSTPCGDSIQAVLAVVNRDLIILPRQLSASQGWQDSTTSSVCSGLVPIVLSTIRTYKVIGETTIDGADALKLERSEKILASGEGSQGQHQIGITGAGTGKAQIYVDRSTGTVLSLTATNQIDLAIRSSGRIQNFTQTSDETTVKKTPR